MAERPAGAGPRYRFGPLERRGLIAGWRGGQIASLVCGLLVAVLALRARPSVPGIAVAVIAVGGAVALACWPVAGRTGEEWLPTVARWSGQRAGGSSSRRSPVPGRGHLAPPPDTPTAPAAPPRRPAGRWPLTSAAGRARRADGAFAGLSLLEATDPGDGGAGRRGPVRSADAGAAAAGAPRGPTGVVFDAASGTYTAAMWVRGHSFSLLGPLERERRVNGWAAVLGSLARQGSLVHRLQWVARTVPDDGRGVREHFDAHATHAGHNGHNGDTPAPPGRNGDSPARRSYADLLDEARAGACRHEVLLCVQISAQGRTARAVRAAGGGRTGACAVLLREVTSLQALLANADVLVDGTLGPADLARVLRRSFETSPAGGPDGGVRVGGATAGRNGGRPDDPAPGADAARWPWPMAVDNGWGELHTDGTWHRTYWVAEWPRVEVGPDFLGPVLLGSARRSVTMVMEPLSPLRATRQVEQARTADVADAELRRRGGFLATARRSRESEVVAQREHELADGHASYRFSGYVTVTAASLPALEQASEATEQAAGQARLELRRLYGDQERAFTCTLPLGRGLS